MEQQITINLSKEEAVFIHDVLTFWMDGMASSKEDTLKDLAIDTVEELSDLYGGLIEQEQTASAIINRLGGMLYG